MKSVYFLSLNNKIMLKLFTYSSFILISPEHVRLVYKLKTDSFNLIKLLFLVKVSTTQNAP